MSNTDERLKKCFSAVFPDLSADDDSSLQQCFRGDLGLVGSWLVSVIEEDSESRLRLKTTST